MNTLFPITAEGTRSVLTFLALWAIVALPISIAMGKVLKHLDRPRNEDEES